MIYRPVGIAIVIALIGMFAVTGAYAAAASPENIVIFGGRSGKVPFPHADHQARLQDCNICHSAFPQEADAMKRMKEKGTLRPKKVMNLQCIKCHKADKRAGKPHGPVTCKTCHIK